MGAGRERGPLVRPDSLRARRPWAPNRRVRVWHPALIVRFSLDPAAHERGTEDLLSGPPVDNAHAARPPVQQFGSAHPLPAARPARRSVTLVLCLAQSGYVSASGVSTLVLPGAAVGLLHADRTIRRHDPRACSRYPADALETRASPGEHRRPRRQGSRNTSSRPEETAGSGAPHCSRPFSRRRQSPGSLGVAVAPERDPRSKSVSSSLE